MRGILLKSSLIKISALVDSLNRFDDTSQLVEAARNIRKIVVAEVAKMNREISALQLRSGVTDLNPVQEMEFGVLEYLEPKT
jgi:hypothetical protein